MELLFAEAFYDLTDALAGPDKRWRSADVERLGWDD